MPPHHANMTISSNTISFPLRVVFCVLSSLIFIGVHAQYSVQIGSLYYYLDYADKTALVAPKPGNDSANPNKYGQYSGEFEFPTEIKSGKNTFQVIGFAENAFKESFITSVRIPEGYTTIGPSAFYGSQYLKTVYLPSTLNTLGERCFHSCRKLTELHVDVIHPSVSEDYTHEGISASENVFAYSSMSNGVVYVPARALDWYKNNWKFLKLDQFIPVCTTPRQIHVSPSFDSEELEDYRSLRHVSLQFEFPDDGYEDALSLAPAAETEAMSDYYVTATLILESGERITLDSRTAPDAFAVCDNTLHISFEDVLDSYQPSFVGRIGGPETMLVRLEVSGQVAIDDCPFSLDGLFDETQNEWTLPLLPAAYDLDMLPTVTPSPAVEGTAFDYDELKTLTFTFEDFESIGVDAEKGDYVTAILYQEGEEVCTLTLDDTEIADNTLTLHLPDLFERVLVRRATGIKEFTFSLDFSAQLAFSDGKTYRMAFPAVNSSGAGSEEQSDEPLSWVVRAVEIPEPTGYQVNIETGATVSLTALSEVRVTFEGVEDISLADELVAHFYMNGEVLKSLTEADVQIEGTTLVLPFGSIDETLITSIGTEPYCYSFSFDLTTQLLTDGYPYDFTLDNESCVWSVPAELLPLPILTIQCPIPSEGDCSSVADLAKLEITVENYETIELPDASDGGAFVAAYVRDGHAVCAAGPASLTIADGRLLVDFSELLSDALYVITPDDSAAMADPEGALPPIEITLMLQATLLFDGFPATVTIDPSSPDYPVWYLEPVVVHTIDAPLVIYAADRLSFTCGVPRAVYTYTLKTSDVTEGTIEVEATKNQDEKGSAVVVPISRNYEITVRASREGYYDSSSTTSYIHLEPNEQ